MPHAAREPAIDPARPIVDPHLHLWDIVAAVDGLQEPQTFLVADAAETIRASGHAVTHTVFVECHAMYRQGGPSERRSLGETEFAAGMAAMAASGVYGPCRIAHRIVANVNLGLGDAIAPLIEAHVAAGGGRLAGVRTNIAFSPAGLFGAPADLPSTSRLTDDAVVAAARQLARAGLNLDVWCLHPQLPQLIALADRVPELTIVLDHLGTPDVRADGRNAFPGWRQHIGRLAERPNVRVKLSGLGMDLERPIPAGTGAERSNALAARWRAQILTAIEAFTPARCMFASNFPPDRAASDYGTIWNAFKRVAATFSTNECDALFRDTAARTYHIDIHNQERP